MVLPIIKYYRDLSLNSNAVALALVVKCGRLHIQFILRICLVGGVGGSEAAWSYYFSQIKLEKF